MTISGDVLGVWITNTGVLLGKFVFLVFLVFYLGFTFLLIRKVSLLNKLLGTPLSSFISFLAWLQLFLALLILIFSLYSLGVVGRV